MQVSWTALKQFAVARSLSIQWIDNGQVYYLAAVDGPFTLECTLNKSNANDDLVDFETNYKASGNLPLWQYDSDGAQIVRQKAAKKGWSFWALPIEITTSTLSGSLYCKDSAGNDISGTSCKIYNSNNEEITTAGVLNANLNTCVKTVIDFEAAFDYEIVGGELRINSNPAQDVRMWIIGAPDIPVNMGGSKEFASGVNLKFLAPDSGFSIDGRVTKYIQYNAVDHRGKLRIMLKHPAGSQINLQFVVHMYRL